MIFDCYLLLDRYRNIDFATRTGFPKGVGIVVCMIYWANRVGKEIVHWIMLRSSPWITWMHFVAMKADNLYMVVGLILSVLSTARHNSKRRCRSHSVAKGTNELRRRSRVIPKKNQLNFHSREWCCHNAIFFSLDGFNPSCLSVKVIRLTS